MVSLGEETTNTHSFAKEGKRKAQRQLKNKDELIEEDDMVLCENWAVKKRGGRE